jgi:hypothetical protein
MIVTMSKAEVIRAIQEEPYLHLGSWAYSKHTECAIADEYKPLNPCGVCAVGAVFRQALDPHRNAVCTLERLTRTKGEESPNFAGGIYQTQEKLFSKAQGVLNQGMPLAALSLVFESEIEGEYDDSDRSYLEIARGQAVKFVQLHYPDSIDIDIEGAAPAKDVEAHQGTP